MFRIGEFSRIAQVSGRTLRHYDHIGLLKPGYVDEATGYRYYTAEQLPTLNRILALKELGLSLDQVARLLEDGISVEEIRGMLTMKKAQVEQTIEQEVGRMREIETRLAQIDKFGITSNNDVVIKSVPAMQVVSFRIHLRDFSEALPAVMSFQKLLPARIQLGNFIAITHSDTFELEDVDMEMGFVAEQAGQDDLMLDITLPTGESGQIRQLPAVETMVTAVRIGDIYESHIAYSTIGNWIALNGYELIGLPREFFIRPPYASGETVTEIQFPVRKTTASALA